jgi:universal stress protein A
MSIKEMVREGEPTEEILKAIEEEKIDLLVMLAHEEGHVEHFLFGRSNEELVRKMPCSIMLVKKEPGASVEEKEDE